MTTRQAAQGLLRLPASHSSRGRHKGCFVSITLPGQHLGELNLSGQGGARRRTCRRTTCPFPLTFTHTAAHHAYSDATTNIYPTTIKTLILCHPNCKSSPRGYVQLIYTLSRDICEHRKMHNNQGKCDSSSNNFYILCITHSHIFRCGLLRS